MSPWRFLTARVQFLGVLEDWWEQQEAACKSAPRGQAIKLEEQSRVFDEFLSRVSAVRHAENPLLLLSPPAPLIAAVRPEVLQLEHGRWRAYYAMSMEEKVIVGLLVINLDSADTLLEQMIAIDDAITRRDWS
jgi:hypothetical protein